MRMEIRARGLVQGVSFRHHAREAALSLGVRGWVRNEADGSVLAVAEGDPDALGKFVEWCRVGPAFARVDRVEARELAPGDWPEARAAAGFEVRR